jgi:hypothetical protein
MMLLTDWRGVALMHEASHLAAARCFGFTDSYGRLFNPAFDEGRVGRTYLVGDGDRSPLTRAVISICPYLTIVGADWDGPEFVGDRADVEATRPAHWPPDSGRSTSRTRRVNSSLPTASASRSMRRVSRSGNRRTKS